MQIPETIAAATVPLEQIPAVLSKLTALVGALAARLISERPAALPAAPAGALIDAQAMARLIDAPESWVRTAARQGRIPYIAVGRYMRFQADDVQAALRRQPRKP